MIRPLLFALFLLSTHVAFSQRESHIGGYYALPVGQFASTSVEEDGGFAKPGWGLMFESRHNIKSVDKLGYLFHASIQWNALNSEALAAAFSSILNVGVVASESVYSPIVLSIGPTYTLSLSDKWEVGLTAEAGIMLNNTRDVTLDLYDPSNGDYLDTHLFIFDNNAAFAYHSQIDLNYTLLPNVMKVGVFADYTGATQKTAIRIGTQSVNSTQDINYVRYGIKLILISKQ